MGRKSLEDYYMDERVYELALSADGPRHEVYVEIKTENDQVLSYHTFEGTSKRQVIEAFLSWAVEHLT